MTRRVDHPHPHPHPHRGSATTERGAAATPWQCPQGGLERCALELAWTQGRRHGRGRGAQRSAAASTTCSRHACVMTAPPGSAASWCGAPSAAVGRPHEAHFAPSCCVGSCLARGRLGCCDGHLPATLAGWLRRHKHRLRQPDLPSDAHGRRRHPQTSRTAGSLPGTA